MSDAPSFNGYGSGCQRYLKVHLAGSHTRPQNFVCQPIVTSPGDIPAANDDGRPRASYSGRNSSP